MKKERGPNVSSLYLYKLSMVLVMEKRLKDNTILIIEDDDALRLFASRLLELEGYNVLQCGTGNEGFKSLQETQVNLLLLDLRLPDTSGWSILEQIKNTPELSEIPVIVFTASAGRAQRDRALSLNAADYLTKPVSASDLKDAVARSLKPEA